MKYVVCVPDGCADQPVAKLDGKTPLEVASMPVLDSLAARGTLGRAAVIPDGLPPGSDVGNMSIFGYDPAKYHTGRAPIEAAALGLRLGRDRVAYRCNLVTLGPDGKMVDFAGGHPDSRFAIKMVEALDAELGGEVKFYPGVSYRHSLIAPAAWVDAECAPPHDHTGSPPPQPQGPAAARLIELMDASREVLSHFDSAANQIWLWGQGFQPRMPSFGSRRGIDAGLVTAVDLIRGLGVLTEIPAVEVEGATAWYDTNYEGKRDAALEGLAAGLDLFIIHVEASDEAGHAGDVEEKVRSLENWDSRILGDLVAGLGSMGDWRMLLLPDHSTPLALRTHTSDPVPYLLVDSDGEGEGGVYTEAGVAAKPLIAGHQLMDELLGGVVTGR
jgi:2,3-bisphosphoglycerate-independent phosphoglycerate mutase